MAKKVLTMIKLQIPAAAANPAPPVGPALGQHGVNIMEFCKAFNAETQADAGTIIPVEITVYEDRSFEFITKTPPRRSSPARPARWASRWTGWRSSSDGPPPRQALPQRLREGRPRPPLRA